MFIEKHFSFRNHKRTSTIVDLTILKKISNPKKMFLL